MRAIPVLLLCCCLFGGQMTLAAEDTTTTPWTLTGPDLPEHALWLESLDTGTMALTGKPATVAKGPGNQPLMLAGVAYAHGLTIASNSFLRIDLKRYATRFQADFWPFPQWDKANARLVVSIDGKPVFASAPDLQTKLPTSPIPIDLDLSGATDLTIALVGRRSNINAALGGARLLVDPAATTRPVAVPMPEATGLTTPVFWLDEINASYLLTSSDSARTGIGSTFQGMPITLGGTLFGHGICVPCKALVVLDTKGMARRFVARVGLQDGSPGTAAFTVLADKQQVFTSGPLRAGDGARPVDVDLTGVRELILSVADAEGDSRHAPPEPCWAGARIDLLPTATSPKDRPVATMPSQEPMAIAAIIDGPEPALHGPLVAGASPRRPFFHALRATGEAPLTYAVSGLPAGLTVDPTNGFISGTMAGPLEARCMVTVRNGRGSATRGLTIRCAEYAMLPTPPMGWNHWNQWAMNINEAKVRAAADALVAKGFFAHGYTYVNIDEGWAGPRSEDGTITLAKGRFTDMKALGDHIHGKGLKFGIYSSPGPLCCGKTPGSYGHEQQDATTWASWGVDYLKYDGCSGNGLPDIQERWKLMRACLDETGRDIVYSTNKYRGEGAQLWRTTMDIRNNWKSLSDCGFVLQRGLESLAGPGRYNDPDMLVVGDPEDLRRGAMLTRNEQITHMTLWSMLAAPLLLGCDLTKADDFLVSLTCNDDVLAINQDPLVHQGACQRRDPATGISDQGTEVWTRPLHDGSVAVALFNRGAEPRSMRVSWQELGRSGPQLVHDCWLRQDRGLLTDGFEARVETHAAVLIRVSAPDKADTATKP